MTFLANKIATRPQPIPHPEGCKTTFVNGINFFHMTAPDAPATEAPRLTHNGYLLVRPMIMRHLTTCNPPAASVQQLKERIGGTEAALYRNLQALIEEGKVTRSLGAARPAMRRPGVFCLTSRLEETTS